MSKTTEVISLRLSKMLLAEIKLAMESANQGRKLEPYERNSWIKAAIKEKLQHLRRSRSRQATPLFETGAELCVKE